MNWPLQPGDPHNWYEDVIVKRQMNKLENEIEEYLKKHPIEHMPPWVRDNALLEIPKFRFRVPSAKQYPGWTRICDHCSVVQRPLSGAFATFYHQCEYRGITVEWPASIGRNYA